GYRQIDFELRTLIYFTLDIDKSAMIFYNCSDGGQPQTGAMLFGGKEWIKDPLDQLRRHTNARIDDTDEQILTGAALMRAGKFFIYQQILDFNDQSTSLRHSIPSIDTQIHQYLIKLCGIGAHKPGIFADDGFQFDRLGKSLHQDGRDL